MEEASYPFVSRSEKSESLKYYTKRVLLQVHPECGLSRQAARLVDAVLASAFNAVMERAVASAALGAAPSRGAVLRGPGSVNEWYCDNHWQTYLPAFSAAADLEVALNPRGIILLCDVLEGLKVFHGELGKHARAEALRACAKAKGVSPEPRGAPISITATAGIQFPVRRFGVYAQRFPGAERVSIGAAIGIAAAVEYICAEVLELAGNCSKDMKQKRIRMFAVNLGIRYDEDLAQLFEPLLNAIVVSSMCRKDCACARCKRTQRYVLAPHVRGNGSLRRF